ncbi:hypothetical protein CONLIGDRAFT_646470 [Coniochaeta ligniaria NRRL 30616]|uniref:Uncharacterized protein n=1 Tax=Coniochaeta ligniaria NRRL 30616 TaxID=1408157 RepID=A0A1J7IG79_9PEZI|nr:hypothetical protein CONLIGDRAFT_646470 [Coniochaeta ligniaria NRRL 30616]
MASQETSSSTGEATEGTGAAPTNTAISAETAVSVETGNSTIEEISNTSAVANMDAGASADTSVTETEAETSTSIGERTETTSTNTATSTEAAVSAGSVDTGITITEEISITYSTATTDLAAFLEPPMVKTEVTSANEVEAKTANEATTSASTEAGNEMFDTPITEPDVDTAAETAQETADNTTTESDSESDAETVVFIGDDSRLLQRPTLVDAMTLFHNIYTFILAPAFNHPAWLLATPVGQRGFPERVRALVDMFDSFPLDNLDPEVLRNLFAGFIQMFCEVEMGIFRKPKDEPKNEPKDEPQEMGILRNPQVELKDEPKDAPGPDFHVPKYGAWCNWKWKFTLEPWARNVHTHRNEWSWGVDGGTRGLAGFVEAVGLWAHILLRMLGKTWVATGLSGAPTLPWVSGKLLYRRACFEMYEYLYKWAVRVQPPGNPVPVGTHQRRDTSTEGEQAGYSSSDYGDEASSTLDRMDLKDDDDDAPWNLPAAHEYGVMAPSREDDYYDQDAAAQAEDAERARISQQILNLQL